MLSHPLLPKLRELRLSGMIETLEERAELAREQSLTPVEFLALLIDDEIERRRQKKQKRMGVRQGLRAQSFSRSSTLRRYLHWIEV